ncbi:hypothetical protein JCM16358_22810 [Halanaerocella petrolearia]
MYVSTKEAAKLCGTSERTIQKNAKEGKYDIQYQEGRGRGGKVLRINVMSLPWQAQVKYWQRENADTGIVRKHTIDQFSGQAREEAVIKKKMIEKADEIIAELKEELGKTEAIKQAVQVVKAMHPDMPFSTGSYYNWSKNLREEGITGLMDERTLSENQQGDRRCPPAVNEEAWKFFLNLYLTQQQRSVAFCHRITKTMAKQEGWGKIPTVRSFRRYVKKYIDPATRVALREGDKALKDKIEPYIERDIAGLESNEIFVGDHSQCDFFVLDEEGNPKRAILTAWMDMRSRTFVGYRLSFSPNLNTIMHSFADACKDYGIPDHVYIDNGKDYRAYQFAGGRINSSKQQIEVEEWKATSMLEILDVQPHFSNPYNARAKPIERKFQDFHNHFDKMFPSYRGNCPSNAPEQLQEVLNNKDKLITIEELQDIFSSWLEVVYHETPQNGKGMKGKTPHTVWKENINEVRKVSERELTFLLTKVKGTRVVGRNGIKMDGLNYYSDELKEITTSGQKVQVRYDPEDLSQVYICDLDDKFLCTAQLVQQNKFVGIDEQSMKDFKRKRNNIRNKVKEDEEYISQSKEFTMEDYLEAKRKENQERARQEALDSPNVVRMHKTDIRESLKKLEEQTQDLPDQERKQVMSEVHQLFENQQQQPVDEEEQRKKDLKDLQDAMGDF